jgi:hypothetical protein
MEPDTTENSQYSETSARIERNFTYQPPNEADRKFFTVIRGQAKEMAEAINNCTPYSREQSLALTHLEQAVMWANAAIARKDK